MNYIFEGKRSGKSFSEMIQLKQKIEKGIKCSVATSNPEKVKRDFEYMTGSKLVLQERIDGLHDALKLL